VFLRQVRFNYEKDTDFRLSNIPGGNIKKGLRTKKFNVLLKLNCIKKLTN